MITKNFRALLTTILESMDGAAIAALPVTDYNGAQLYLSSKAGAFPATVTTAVRIGSTVNLGIYLGSGNRQESENDYNLQTRITTGLTAQTPSKVTGLDSDGNLYLEYLFTLTNTTENAIIVREIGYVQGIYAGTTVGSTVSLKNFLLDRTVLQTPVTIPAGESAAIKYRLKTVPLVITP